MAAENIRSRVSADAEPTTSELIDRLSRFEGPPDEFLVNLLAVQCHLASASAGAILRAGPEGQPEVISVFPPLEPGSEAPAWLVQAAGVAGRAAQEAKTAIYPVHEPTDLYGEPARRHLVVLPLARGESVRGVAVFLTEARDPAELAAVRERLELSTSLLGLYELRLALQRRSADLRRLQVALETLSAVNETDRFAGTAMGLCNEVAARWQCDRVSLGFLKGRYVQLKAMSHTEKFSRKMALVQDIESAMEECLDQDLEVIHPAEPEAVYVSRAAAELSARHGPAAIVSLPIRRNNEVVAVLTCERPAEKPFSPEEIETLRLTLDLCSPRLVNLYEHDRWVGARLAGSLRKGLAALVGPRQTWWKVAAVAAAVVLGLLIFKDGDYKATASFVLEATKRQVVPAPFDGYLKTVEVDPGDAVIAGKTVLATLDTAELRLQLGAAEAKRLTHLKEAAAAMRDGKTAEAQIAQAQAEEAAAEIELLRHRIRQARIVSEISGIVVSGDLKRQVGAPVKTGDVLFEVAPLEDLRAELSVPEDQIAEVRDGSKPGEEPSRGELATASYPDLKIPFVVERINPVAEVVEQQNVFKVRVRLEKTYPWMRPGMEGSAKIYLGRRRLGYLLTRKLVNWLRMKLWI